MRAVRAPVRKETKTCDTGGADEVRWSWGWGAEEVPWSCGAVRCGGDAVETKDLALDVREDLGVGLSLEQLLAPGQGE